MISTRDLPTQQLDFLADRVPPILDKCHTPFDSPNKLLKRSHQQDLWGEVRGGHGTLVASPLPGKAFYCVSCG